MSRQNKNTKSNKRSQPMSSTVLTQLSNSLVEILTNVKNNCEAFFAAQHGFYDLCSSTIQDSNDMTKISTKNKTNIKDQIAQSMVFSSMTNQIIPMAKQMIDAFGVNMRNDSLKAISICGKLKELDQFFNVKKMKTQEEKQHKKQMNNSLKTVQMIAKLESKKDQKVAKKAQKKQDNENQIEVNEEVKIPKTKVTKTKVTKTKVTKNEDNKKTKTTKNEDNEETKVKDNEIWKIKAQIAKSMKPKDQR